MALFGLNWEESKWPVHFCPTVPKFFASKIVVKLPPEKKVPWHRRWAALGRGSNCHFCQKNAFFGQKMTFFQKVHFIQKCSVTQNTVFQYVKNIFLLSQKKLVFFTILNLAIKVKIFMNPRKICLLAFDVTSHNFELKIKQIRIFINLPKLIFHRVPKTCLYFVLISGKKCHIILAIVPHRNRDCATGWPRQSGYIAVCEVCSLPPSCCAPRGWTTRTRRWRGPPPGWRPAPPASSCSCRMALECEMYLTLFAKLN